MNLTDTILNRTSCRSYDGTALIAHWEEAMLWAADHTPSAGNIRPLTFRAVTDAQIRTLLAQDAAHQDWIATAPLIIVILADYAKIERKYHRRGRQYALLEAGHAAQNICLMATAFELGSCCVGAFRESRVLQSLGLDVNCGLTPVYMVTVGRKKI